MDQKLVSIILPCYNCQYTIEETLDSVINQTYNNLELVILNDGSTDATERIIERYFEKNPIRNLKYIKHNNIGLAETLGIGVKNSKGDYIARIDNDDRWMNQHIEKLMDILENDRNIVLIGSNAQYINESGDTWEQEIYGDHEKVIKYFMKDNPFIHSSVIFKRDAYNRTNKYDYNLPYKNQICDYNLFLELSKVGKILILKEKTVIYKVNTNSMSRNIKIIDNYNARLFMIKKSYSLYKKYFIIALIYYLYINFNLMYLKHKGS